MEDVTTATMNVSLPDPMKEWVEDQTRTGRYSNSSLIDVEAASADAACAR